MRKCHHHFNLHLLILHNHGTHNPRQKFHIWANQRKVGPGKQVLVPSGFRHSKPQRFGSENVLQSDSPQKRWEISSVSHVFFSDVLVYYLGKSKKNVMLILGVLWKRGVETCSTRNSPVASAAQHEKKPIPRKVQRKRKHLLFDTRHPKKSKVAADVSPKTCPTTLFTCTNGRTWGEKYFDTSEETGRVQTYLLESLRPLIYFSDFFSSHFLATFHSHNAPSTRHPKSLLSFHLTHASWYLGR